MFVVRCISLALVIAIVSFPFGWRSWAVVTSDGYGTHVVNPGEEAFGIDHDGVAQILMNGNFGCTGALLEGGMHVLTAGHCLNNPNTALITVRFTLEEGVVDIQAHSWSPHPEFPQISGTDVGIITLSERAPPEIPRYSPLRALGLDIDSPNTLFGYGVTGYAGTGRDARDGNKRGGRNRYEATSSTMSINAATVGGSDDESWLFSDFDSGLAENDAFGFHFGKVDLGFGVDEVYASSGDSGAPIFVHNRYSNVIAGVVSGGTRYSGTPNADLDETVNATWGQFSRDTRVAAPWNLEFIESYTSTALEPQPLTPVRSAFGLDVEVETDAGQIVYIRASDDFVQWGNLLVHRTTQSIEQFNVVSQEQMAGLGAVFLVAVREPTTEPELPDLPDPPEPSLQPLPPTGLIGSNAPTGELVSVDTDTAVASGLGETILFGLHGLAFDVNTKTLYGVAAATDSLHTVEASTGHLERVGSLGVNFPSTAGLAFDPDNNILYATSNGSAANLYIINTTTGVASEVGPLGVNVPGLAYVPSVSTLYGVSGQTDSLYTIDVSTGFATLVGELGINTSFCGLAYDADSGGLYLSDSLSDSLYSINRNSGAATLVGELGFPQVTGLSGRNKAVASP